MENNFHKTERALDEGELHRREAGGAKSRWALRSSGGQNASPISELGSRRVKSAS